MPVKLSDAIQNLLSGKWSLRIVVSLALILTLSSLGTGLQFDDYAHYGKMKYPRAFPKHKSDMMQLFTFADGDSDSTRQTIIDGRLPWWTDPELKLDFFRPLTVATHWVDHHCLFLPMLMHLHSLLWYALLVSMAALVYRRMMTPMWIAGLAALLFAIDDAHGVTVSWLANRYALIAGFFGFLAIYLHDRWRRDGWSAGAVFAPLVFLLSLLSAEAGAAAGAYILSYEIFLVSGRWQKKALGVLPYILLGAAWMIVYRALGYGSYASGFYLDPGKNPLNYTFSLFERIPLLFNGQWMQPWAEIHSLLPKPDAFGLLAITYLLVAMVAVVLIPLIRQNAVAKFWALGMVLSLLPISAGSPHNRLLVFVGLGAMGLLAQLIAGWWEKAAWLPSSRLLRLPAQGIIVLLIINHLVIAPLLLPFSCLAQKILTETMIETPLLQLAEQDSFAGKTVVFINPPMAFTAMSSYTLCLKNGIPAPRKVRPLTSAINLKIDVTRVDDNTLDVEPEHGFLANGIDGLFRGRNNPMQVGHIVNMGEMNAQVLSMTRDQRPLKVRFSFLLPLNHRSLLFYEWQDDGYESFDLPAIGQTVTLDAVDLMNL